MPLMSRHRTGYGLPAARLCIYTFGQWMAPGAAIQERSDNEYVRGEGGWPFSPTTGFLQTVPRRAHGGGEPWRKSP